MLLSFSNQFFDLCFVVFLALLESVNLQPQSSPVRHLVSYLLGMRLQFCVFPCKLVRESSKFLPLGVSIHLVVAELPLDVPIQVCSADLEANLSESLYLTDASPKFVRRLDLRERHATLKMVDEGLERALFQLDLL